jgi:hypothetical protein
MTQAPRGVTLYRAADRLLDVEAERSRAAVAIDRDGATAGSMKERVRLERALARFSSATGFWRAQAFIGRRCATFAALSGRGAASSARRILCGAAATIHEQQHGRRQHHSNYT